MSTLAPVNVAARGGHISMPDLGLIHLVTSDQPKAGRETDDRRARGNLDEGHALDPGLGALMRQVDRYDGQTTDDAKLLLKDVLLSTALDCTATTGSRLGD